MDSEIDGRRASMDQYHGGNYPAISHQFELRSAEKDNHTKQINRPKADESLLWQRLIAYRAPVQSSRPNQGEGDAGAGTNGGPFPVIKLMGVVHSLCQG